MTNYIYLINAHVNKLIISTNTFNSTFMQNNSRNKPTARNW